MKASLYSLILLMSILFIQCNNQPQQEKQIEETVEPEPSNMKHGMTEDKRREIWDEIIQAQDRASAEAKSKYPTDNANKVFWNGNTFLQAKWEKTQEKNTELNDELREKYEGEVASSNSIEMETLDSIKAEGMENEWPFPY